jgi:probable phosphoglycerate mutase
LITGLVGSLLGLPIQAWPQLAGIGNCHWTVLTRRPGQTQWRLSVYNAGITG